MPGLQEAHGQAKSDWVFPYVKDREKHIQDVKNSYRRAVRLAGIKPITFHQLRHTFCSRLAAAGVDIATIQELAGHSSIVMTRRYMHPHNGLKQQAVELLAAPENGQEGATKSATLVILPGQGEHGPNGQDAELEGILTV